MEQKCSELTDYLHLLQKGNKRSAEDDKRYLQYTNEFKREDTNFCYWYKQNGGVVYQSAGFGGRPGV